MLTPRILVADDDATQRAMFLQFFKQCFSHAAVTIVDDGDAALQAYQTHEADLLVLDNNMPGRSGSALIQHLRQTGAVTPVILLSGSIGTGTLSVDGLTQYMPKPVSISDLAQAINRLLTQ